MTALEDMGYDVPPRDQPPEGWGGSEVEFLRRRVHTLARDHGRLVGLVDDAICALHEAGLHEAADRLQREQDPW